jgi:hypothetical protein
MSKNIGRRLFSRGAVGVPVALGLPSVATVIPQPPPSPNFYNSTLTGAEAGSSISRSLIGRAWDIFSKESHADRQQQEIRWQRRNMMGGLDPDLAVLNSMSMGRRIQIQMDREAAYRAQEQSLRLSIFLRLGGKREDFE